MAISPCTRVAASQDKGVTDNRDAAAVLKWRARDQDRYERRAANGASNIKDFNRKVQEGNAEEREAERRRVRGPEYKAGSYLYLIIIDEPPISVTVQGEIEARWR